MRPALIVNTGLLVAYPVAWFAPMLSAEMLWFFGDTVSLGGGLLTLVADAPVIGVIVLVFAVLAPYGKVIATQLKLMGHLPASWAKALPWLARLSMADIFLVALYIIIAKGLAGASVTPMWGLYLFTACVLTSLFLSWSKA